MVALDLNEVSLAGHSMGGRIALSLAQNFPGKVKSLIMAASDSTWAFFHLFTRGAMSLTYLTLT